MASKTLLDFNSANFAFSILLFSETTPDVAKYVCLSQQQQKHWWNLEKNMNIITPFQCMCQPRVTVDMSFALAFTGLWGRAQSCPPLQFLRVLEHLLTLWHILVHFFRFWSVRRYVTSQWRHKVTSLFQCEERNPWFGFWRHCDVIWN